MNIHQHAPPGASGGHGRLAPDPWAIGIPPTYEAALSHLKALGREMQEAVVAGLIDHLDAIDGDVDLEPWLAGHPPHAGIPLDVEGDPSDDEPSLGAPEAKLSELPVPPWRAEDWRGADVFVDPTCDQSDWPGDHGERPGDPDLEQDAADDEPSLGSIERHPSVPHALEGAHVDPRSSQEAWALGAFCNQLPSDDREDDAGDNPEEEDEHGADDDKGEEALGWCENVSQLALGENTADGDVTAPNVTAQGSSERTSTMGMKTTAFRSRLRRGCTGSGCNG